MTYMDYENSRGSMAMRGDYDHQLERHLYNSLSIEKNESLLDQDGHQLRLCILALLKQDVAVESLDKFLPIKKKSVKSWTDAVRYHVYSTAATITPVQALNFDHKSIEIDGNMLLYEGVAIPQKESALILDLMCLLVDQYGPEYVIRKKWAEKPVIKDKNDRTFFYAYLLRSLIKVAETEDLKKMSKAFLADFQKEFPDVADLKLDKISTLAFSTVTDAQTAQVLEMGSSELLMYLYELWQNMEKQFLQGAAISEEKWDILDALNAKMRALLPEHLLGIFQRKLQILEKRTALEKN